jgi:ADP-heptose:LPS heptosyltransferase
MEALRADYTEVWVAGQNVPLVRFADRVRSIASVGLDLLGLEGVEAPRALIDNLRGFDSIVSWYGTNRMEFRQAVAHYPFTFLPALPPRDGQQHAVDFYLEQARALGGQPNSSEPHIDCAVSHGGYAVIHPFSGSPAKNWPMEQYRELAVQLQSRCPVKWCAGPEEELAGAVRFADLYELACWLTAAQVYIGNDSGISHLAAATGIPTVALFIGSNPQVWSPRGPNVKIVPVNKEISVQSILDAIESIL